MNIKYRMILISLFFSSGCHAEVPRVDFTYKGNGDQKIIEFMRGHYMSSEEGVAKYLKRHLEKELLPGQAIDKPYLLQRGAVCADQIPVACRFTGTADEHRSGLPKANADRAHRITKIEAQVILTSPVRVEVEKELIYPDSNEPE